MSTVAQVIAVLKSAVQEQSNRGVQWLSWGLLVFAVLACAAVPLFMHSIGPDKQLFIIGLIVVVVFGVLSWMWWMYIVSNVLRQCTTAVSKLVPMQRKAIALALSAVWLLLCLVFAVAISLIAEKGLIAWLVCGAFLSFIVSALRYPALWLVWIMWWVVPASGFSAWFITAYEAVEKASYSPIPSLALVLLSVFVWSLVVMRIFSRHSLEQLRNSPTSMASIKSMGDWRSAMRNPQQNLSLFPRPKFSWAVNTSARASSRVASPIARRLSLSLGNIFNPFIYAARGLFAVAVMVFSFWILSLYGKLSVNIEHMLPIFWITVTGSFLSTCTQALWQTRREQALMCLLPGVPRGQALNRLLLSMLIKRHIAASLISIVGMVLVVGLFTTRWMELLLTASLILPILILMCTYSGLIDYSSYKGPNGALLVLNALGGLCLWFLLKQASGAGYLTLAIVSTLILAAVIFAWRWRVMSSAPQAWPTGRLATFGNKNYNAE
jgi:hypothetical protein